MRRIGRTVSLYFPLHRWERMQRCIFWDSFESEQEIRRYFAACYAYAENKIGFLKTDGNIICAAIITEKVRRNLFFWYLPVTETWHTKVMSNERNESGTLLQLRDEFDEPLYNYHCEIDEPRLSSTEFWKKRGMRQSPLWRG